MKNLQIIEIRYLAPTNTRGARIKLLDTRFKLSVTLSRDYALDSTVQAADYLTANGFNIIARARNEITGADYLLVDKFTPIKGAKK